MRVDPFRVKQFSKLSPLRLAYTSWARLAERQARLLFPLFQLPPLPLERPVVQLPAGVSWEETQVTPLQASYLLRALELSAPLQGCVVEVGAWRGVTTALLASHTEAQVVAVDPFVGDTQGSIQQAFLDRTGSWPNVTLERRPFGEAARAWTHGPAKLVFVDATHDYANTAHDAEAAIGLTVPGGLLAFHDVDNPAFAGCRRAVYERYGAPLELVAHVQDLALLRMPATP